MKTLARTFLAFFVVACSALAAEPTKPKPASPADGMANPTAAEPAPKVDIQPVLLRSRKPIYPQTLKDSGLSGQVIVEFEVDAEGIVKNAKAIKSPHPDFSKAALDSVKSANYRPARKDGKPVSIKLRETIDFQPNKK